MTRILPPVEWPRLAGTDLGPFIGHLDPQVVRIVAVEEDGQIVGAWPLVRTLHAHGAWIAERYRRTGTIARRLVRALHDEAALQGVPTILIVAETAEQHDWLERLGGEVLPGTPYAVPRRHV